MLSDVKFINTINSFCIIVDGSGHQYVAIPLSPSTAELIQTNKVSTNAALQNNGKGMEKSGACKGDYHSVNIKEELE